MLASHFGGGPAYWLDPELDERIIATAVALLPEADREQDDDGA